MTSLIPRKAIRKDEPAPERMYDGVRRVLVPAPPPPITDDLIHCKIENEELDVFLKFLNTAAKAYYAWLGQGRPGPERVDRVLASFAGRLVSRPLPRNWNQLLDAMERMKEDAWKSEA